MSRNRTPEYQAPDIYGIIPRMARELNPEGEIACGRRLYVTRKALDNRTQAQMAKVADITPSAWSNAERGDNYLGHDAALRICRRFSLTMDWLFRNDPEKLPPKLQEAIFEEEAKLEAKKA